MVLLSVIPPSAPTQPAEHHCCTTEWGDGVFHRVRMGGQSLDHVGALYDHPYHQILVCIWKGVSHEVELRWVVTRVSE